MMDTDNLNLPDFPWYSYLEGIDYANWPLWLVCGLIGFAALTFIATALLKAWDHS